MKRKKKKTEAIDRYALQKRLKRRRPLTKVRTRRSGTPNTTGPNETKRNDKQQRERERERGEVSGNIILLSGAMVAKMRSKEAKVVGVVFSGVGSLSSDVIKLRSVAENSSYYPLASRHLVRHGVSLDQVWERVGRSTGHSDVAALDEIVLQVLVQLAGAEMAQWTLSEESSIVCVGHSIGEIAGAIFSGHLTVEEGMDVALKLAQVAEKVKGGGLVYGPLLPGERAASVNFTEEGSQIGAVAVLEMEAPATEQRKRVHTNYPWHHECYREHAARAGFEKLAIAKKNSDLLSTLLASSIGGPVRGGSLLDGQFWSNWTWNGVNLEAALLALAGESVQAVVEVGAHPMLQSALRATLPGAPHLHLFERGLGLNASGRSELIRLSGELQPVRLARELNKAFPRVVLDHSKTWLENGLNSADLVPAATKLCQRGMFPELKPQDFFRFVTPRSLLESQGQLSSSGSRAAKSSRGGDEHAVVISAMSCLLPGNLASPTQLAGFTRTQGDAVRHEPSFDGGKQPAGYLGNISIDYSKFGLSKSEVATLDPQQALVLNCVDKLLNENGSIELPSETGVFIGAWNSEFKGDQSSVFYPTGTNPSLLAARVSHVYGLTGPSKVINTACASSLDAVLEAFRAIQSGEVGMAIAGGVNLLWDKDFSQCMKQSGFLAPGFRCRTFDKSADGYVRAEGCGLVLLTREDLCPGGRFYAKVLGGAANHNGGRSASITAPSPQAQEECINKALADAGILASQVDYVECHGTGTKIGDPIEYSALAKTFGAEREGNPCYLASVKSNIGHLESAAGVAGLIHAAMVLTTKCVPQMANFAEVNPLLDVSEGLEIATKQNIEGSTLEIAGISSFGFGGSNVHMLLRCNSRGSIPTATPPCAPSAEVAATTHIFQRPAFDDQPQKALLAYEQSLPAKQRQQQHQNALVQKSYTQRVEAIMDEQDDAEDDVLSETFWKVVSDVTGTQVNPGDKILLSGVDSLGLTELFLRIEQSFDVQATDLARYLGGEFTWADMETDVTGGRKSGSTTGRSMRRAINTTKSKTKKTQEWKPDEQDDAEDDVLSETFWKVVSDVTGTQVNPGDKILLSGVDSLGLTELFLRIEQSFDVQATDLARYLGGEFTWADMETDVTGRSVCRVIRPMSGKTKKEQPRKRQQTQKDHSARPTLSSQSVSHRSAGDGQFSTWALPRFPNMIGTTHVGSLPRAKKEDDQFEQLEGVIRKQLELGITYINDGEVGRGDYASSALQRMTGFEIQEDGPRAPQPQDLHELRCISCRFLSRAGLITLNDKVITCNPVCVGEIKYVGHSGLQQNLKSVQQTLKRNNAGLPGQAFWTVPSPGTMAGFFECQAKDIYPTYESYVAGIGKALAEEYRTIVAAGFTLQVDCPDLAMSRHTKFQHLGLVAWKRNTEMHVRVLNDALEGIPPEKVRIHLCWGNYAGTHHRDVGAQHVLPTAFKINAQGLSFEGGNNRHAGDHALFKNFVIPEGKVLYPGVVDTSATSVESADIICQRICNFAHLVGPSRVVACTDCGFATTAETQGVPADVAWMKLRALVAGARQASALFFPKVVPAFVPRPSKRIFYFCSALDKSSTTSSVHIETRLILVSELSGKDAEAVASHIRLFVDVPFAFETDGSPMAEMFVKVLRDQLADGKFRNCPLYPLDEVHKQPDQLLSQKDMILDTSSCIPKKSYEVVVVGGGVVGLMAAKKLLDAGIDVCVVEKEQHVGGIWTTFANETSQVNSSEGSYRIFEDYRKRANRDHSSTSEIRADILLIANELKEAKRLFTNTCVEDVKSTGSRANGRKQYFVHVGAASTPVIECQGIIMAVNDRVGRPRPIQWPKREQFAGQVIDGFGGDAEKREVDWVGKRVVVVGMGAFAVENARTALENGAAHVTVLARRHGTICPKFIDYINFVHRTSAENTSAQDGAMDTTNNSKNMFLWRKLYETSYSTMPECWLGQIKHTGHTISVSDVWFIAHFLGLLETQVGEISHFSNEGVVLKDGADIEADIVVRCTGFERANCVVESISSYNKMSGINYLDEHVMYLADAYIDDDAFNSFFGSSVLEMAKFYIMVFEHFFKNPPTQEEENKINLHLPRDISINSRAWSHYIAGANFLVKHVPAIKAKADKIIHRRYLNFVETQTPEEYIAANKREWHELHDLLSQSKIDSSCYLPYPEWNT